jgi:hypothetical protein
VQYKLFLFLILFNLHICKSSQYNSIIFKKMAHEISLDNVGGIFVVLLAGMGLACSQSTVTHWISMDVGRYTLTTAKIRYRVMGQD